ncbi:GNAT family N-acetyltransferase [Shewanella colwelliana]|uniref:GCN5 family acetyltransferase n=1 Tax=Shewanella colwelliana TaxID=23 RepID=A0A1E5IYN3_SHECO|nr:GNAT family N-acetyltransferase [Shewanella colwelliana]OEG75660.1 GCN5 family acetyltransferase [Shewanella colwelliana]
MYHITIERHTQITDTQLLALIELNRAIPEFESRYTLADYQQRLQNKPALLQFIYVEGELAGFKLGYSEKTGQFYSWLGGILPDFRQLGLAKTLLVDQEAWGKDNGISHIEVKTYNRFATMLQMLIRQGYQIAALQSATNKIDDNKLILNKLIC